MNMPPDETREILADNYMMMAPNQTHKNEMLERTQQKLHRKNPSWYIDIRVGPNKNGRQRK